MATTMTTMVTTKATMVTVTICLSRECAMQTRNAAPRRVREVGEPPSSHPYINASHVQRERLVAF